MKTLSIIAALFLCGCERAGYNKPNCRQSASEAFPNGEVTPLPGYHYTFIARDSDGSIWYVETANSDDSKVTSKTRLFRPLTESSIETPKRP